MYCSEKYLLTFLIVLLIKMESLFHNIFINELGTRECNNLQTVCTKSKSTLFLGLKF